METYIDENINELCKNNRLIPPDVPPGQLKHKLLTTLRDCMLLNGH